MPKNIIFCADGTWNGPEDASGESVFDAKNLASELRDTPVTNVVKFYANIAGSAIASSIGLADEDEKSLVDAGGQVVQVAKYLHGVGDSRNIFVKMAGGVFGIGVIARIVRGFTFISRNYQPGDAIHICGFSRGAYTARALGGMIANVGLLDPSTYDPTVKFQAYRLGVAAWAKSKRLQLNGAGKLTSGLNDMIGLIETLVAKQLSSNSLRPDVPIRSIAVWDTVGSMGIPEYVKGARADLFRFVDTDLSAKVEAGFHAMALDEQRSDFTITKWNVRDGITQRWFIGAHADVGGGYPEAQARLSDLALQWLATNLIGQGVKMSNPVAYTPDITNILTQPIHTPWSSPPFDHLGTAQRVIASTDQIDDSVRARWNADATYRPGPLVAASYWL
jgi:uncharacterized protein (DUF2235 family)